MAQTLSPGLRCTGCGRRYRWRPELSGGMFKCACGTVMTAPGRPAPSDEDQYDLASALRPEPLPPLAPPAPRAARPNRPRPATSPILAYQNKSAAAAAPDRHFPNKLMDLQFPLVLLGVAVGVQFLANWWSQRASSPLHALADVGADLVPSTVLSLLAVFWAARRRGFQLGPFWAAVLKLSALSVAPSAAMVLLGLAFGWVPLLGILFTWLLGFCFYFALIGVFFDLDQADTWYCVVVIFLLKLAAALGAAAVLHWWR